MRNGEKTAFGPKNVAAPATYLEGQFPFDAVSAVAKAERFAKDYVYMAHKWWARRPPSTIRALLVASVLSPDASEDEFWSAYDSDDALLEGLHVLDPFMGGATTLVEASRLGASVTGIDVDPLAVEIARDQLSNVDVQELTSVGEHLVAYLRSSRGDMYPGSSSKAEPLHYFWLRKATCLDCGQSELLYRSPVIARDIGRPGAVVREHAIVCFCPECLDIHNLQQGRRQLQCCSRRWKLDVGTFRLGKYWCSSCGARHTHEQLQTALLPRVLLAVEETVEKAHRRIRKPRQLDLAAITIGAAHVSRSRAQIPSASLEGVDGGRPKRYGFKLVSDLFSERQQVLFASTFQWIREADMSTSARRRLLLAASNALGANNLLCGYATDYGRISPLFSAVRSYSMPVLSVELNPLHRSGGRGTLHRTILRARNGASQGLRRRAYKTPAQSLDEQSLSSRRSGRFRVLCASADRPIPTALGRAQVCVTDPPYFDFIPYSDLSLLYRSWLHTDDTSSLGGAPIYPVGENPREEFARRLGRAFNQIVQALDSSAALTFTFHSTNADAWAALEDALCYARLRVTTLFPVWADARAAGHGHAGNCEWDIVFVCRRNLRGIEPTTASIDEWLSRLDAERVLDSDRMSMKRAIATAESVNARHRGGRREQDTA